MKRKQPWMYIGAPVLAAGRPGTITKMQENNLYGIDYVYYIEVRLDGAKHSGNYHPNDIVQLLEEEEVRP